MIPIFIIAFAVLPALSGFAGGAGDPAVAVSDAPVSSLLISINWSDVRQPENYRWGLYRFDIEEKTYTLATELESLQSSYLDEDLEPPLSKYFYKVERAGKNDILESPKSVRINRDDVAEQRVSYAAGNSFMPPYTASSGAPRLSGSPVRHSATNEGIYVGIISFSGRVTDITQRPDGSPALVPLDAPGRQTLLEYLNRGYVPSKSNGTALYYADHKALANLTAMEKEGSLPANIDSVTVVTFTDGTDTSSTDAEFVPIEERDFRRRSTGAAYRTYISRQLATRRVDGVKVDAWSIGIRGKDIESNIEFSQTLESVASSPDNVAEFSFISQIDEKLAAIADRLNIYTPKMNFTFSTPAYPVNTLVRLTFDGGIRSPDYSEYYVDARVNWDEANKSYCLTALNSYGIVLAGGRRIEGRRNGTSIYYTLTLNSDFKESNVRQWYAQPGENAGWTQNSECETEKTADFTHERKSAIVYLVLDCSSSLTEKDINDIRAAITAFIDKLYETSSSGVKLATVGNGYPQRPDTGNAAGKPEQPAQRQPQKSAGAADADKRVHGQAAAAEPPGSQPPAQPWRRSYADKALPQEVYQKPAIPAQPSRTAGQGAAALPSAGAVKSPPLVPAGKRNFYWVQIGAYSDAARARRALDSFKNTGYGRAEIFTSDLRGAVRYRVKAGPYSDKSDAENTLARMKSYSAEYKDCFIINE